MTELFTSVFHFLTDSTRKLTSKAALVISFFILLMLADNIFGFSFYYNNEKKLEQVKEIDEVFKDSSLSASDRQHLLKLRQDVISHQSLKDYALSFLSNISFNNSKSTMSANPNNASPIERNNFLHFISSAWLMILIMIVIPFFAFKDKSLGIAQIIIVLIFAEALFYLIGWLEAKLFSFIPILFGRPYLNYILNFLLNIVLIFPLAKAGKKK